MGASVSILSLSVSRYNIARKQEYNNTGMGWKSSWPLFIRVWVLGKFLTWTFPNFHLLWYSFAYSFLLQSARNIRNGKTHHNTSSLSKWMLSRQVIIKAIAQLYTRQIHHHLGCAKMWFSRSSIAFGGEQQQHKKSFQSVWKSENLLVGKVSENSGCFWASY